MIISFFDTTVNEDLYLLWMIAFEWRPVGVWASIPVVHIAPVSAVGLDDDDDDE